MVFAVEFMTTAAAAEIHIDSTKTTTTTDDDCHVVITGRLGNDDEEHVEWAALPFIFAVGWLSFHDARPRGNSDRDFTPEEQWLPDDMLRHVRFQDGALHSYVDYEHGRQVKTRVDVRADGTFIVETTNRGEAATRWLARLQGRTIIAAVPDATVPLLGDDLGDDADPN